MGPNKHYINFNADLVPIQNQNQKKAAEIAPSNGDIWDEFSEQRQHQSINKSISYKARLAFFMHIRCKFNAQFGWDITYDKIVILISTYV